MVNIVEINESNVSLLDKLYEGSAFTIEGAGGDLNDWIAGLQREFTKRGIGELTTVYTFKGSLMNKRYNLKGTVSYQKDLTFLCFTLDNLDVGKLTVLKLVSGSRWFDDIVNNNALSIHDVLLN